MAIEAFAALTSVFDTIACFGDIWSRADAKEQEVATLRTTVESISASVQAFASGLQVEEREETFYSNPVFQRLHDQVKICEDVISTRCKVLALQNSEQQPKLEDQASPQWRDGLRGLRSLVKQKGAESIEALSGKFGSLSAALKLPEDELEKIRRANTELQSLVPLLNLAINCHTSRGCRRRPADMKFFVPDGKRPCLEAPKIGSDGDTNSFDVGWSLQLVSEWPAELPALSPTNLRTASSSSVSLGSGSGDGSGDGSEPALSSKRIFGRQELKDRLPSSFTLPCGRLQKPFFQYVSREFCMLEEKIVEVPVSEPQAKVLLSQDLDAATLPFDGEMPASQAETLPMVPPAPVEAVKLEAKIQVLAKCLSPNGLHFRAQGDSFWRWVAQGETREMCAGDCIACLLESPPGSYTQGPQKDLEAHEVRCLLGVEFRS
jgi:hypothetical protein